MAYQQDLLRSQTIKSGKVRVISSNPAAADAAVKAIDQILNS